MVEMLMSTHASCRIILLEAEKSYAQHLSRSSYLRLPGGGLAAPRAAAIGPIFAETLSAGIAALSPHAPPAPGHTRLIRERISPNDQICGQS